MNTQRETSRWATPVILVMFYIGTFIAVAFPAVILGIGIQAIGRAQGWWVGDSTRNDGEEVLATVIGGLGTLGVLTVATGLGVLTLRGLGKSVRFTVVALTLGTVGVVGAHVLLALYLFKPV